MSSFERYTSVYFQTEVQARQSFRRGIRTRRLAIAACLCAAALAFAFVTLHIALPLWVTK